RQPRAQGDGCAVRANRDFGAVPDSARVRVRLGELDLGGRTLELQLGDALDGRARKERPVADEPQIVLVRDGQRLRLRFCRLTCGGWKRGEFTDLPERD